MTNKPTLKSYLKTLLTKTHADLKIAEAAAVSIDERVSAMVEDLVSDAKLYAMASRRKTIMTKDVDMAVKMTLKQDGGTAESIVTAMTAALEKYRTEEAKGSRSARAGFVFPVSRIESQMRGVAAPLRLSEEVGVSVTAAAELGASVLVDAAGAVAREENKKIVTPSHVADALEKLGAWKLLMNSPRVRHPGQSGRDSENVV